MIEFYVVTQVVFCSTFKALLTITLLKMPPNSLFRSLVLYFATNMQHSVQDRPFETLWFTEVIFNMYFEISTNYPESTWREMIEWLVERRFLRACPREHRAVVLHAISPISLKLCQFKGSTSKLKKTNRFLFWFFPGGDRPPPRFSWFSPRKSLQNR